MWTKAGFAIVLNHSNLCIRCVSTSSSLSKKNHYEVLEIPRAATPKDIRKAFLKKSKEFHPDIQQRKNLSQAQIDANHETFVQINTAYEILSRKHDRKNYDRELRAEQAHQVYEKYGVGKEGKTVNLDEMTMEDRARVYGYYKDVHFQYNNDKYWIAGACIFVAIASYVIHFNIAKLSYKSHANALDKMTKELSEIEEEKKSQQHGFDALEIQRNWIMKNDNASGDNLREFDKYQEKLAARKRPKIAELVVEEQ